MRNIVLKKKYAKTRFVGDTIQVSLHNVKDLSPHDGEYLSFGLSLYEANITLDHCKWGYEFMGEVVKGFTFGSAQPFMLIAGLCSSASIRAF